MPTLVIDSATLTLTTFPIGFSHGRTLPIDHFATTVTTFPVGLKKASVLPFLSATLKIKTFRVGLLYVCGGCCGTGDATVVPVIGQVAPLATTETVLYTVPANKKITSALIVVCNQGVGVQTYRVSISIGGGATVQKDYLFYDTNISARTTYTISLSDLGISLNSGDIVRVYASTGNFSFSIFGKEVK